MAAYEYYERKINYYETDKMSIVHHSNYARFLEEARIDLMENYNLPFAELEDRGYMIPVLELQGSFIEAVRFGETVRIYVYIDTVTSARFKFKYKIFDAKTGKLKHTAESSHCIIDSEFRPVAFKRLPQDLKDRLEYMLNVHPKAQ